MWSMSVNAYSHLMRCEFQYERDDGSKDIKPSHSTWMKKHYKKCLACTSGCYGCENDDHKVRDYPTIVSRQREAKQSPSNSPNVGEPKKSLPPS